MDPNLVAALMNGRNNQDQFGGANGWWLWIIVLFWLWGGRGFGNGFGNGGENCANGLPAQLNNDYGRELLMQAIQGNRSAIEQIANALNCTTTQLQSAICNVQGAIDKHRRTLEACDSILEEINPAFKQTKDQDRKIKNLEEKVDRMGSSFDELKELLIKKLG